ncbi:hypothetical protein OPT61_g10398 [Boeremia exigua]|uniref:Uncharacterized protein n=1 Tax=Boeremia exigua TaxID=749465 RepID=A0ACC2HQS1_9PLEO|nr:hypothetical protein OPT61_g10398 [Boeremia exigua]
MLTRDSVQEAAVPHRRAGMGRVRHDHRPDGRAQGRRAHTQPRPELPVGALRGQASSCMYTLVRDQAFASNMLANAITQTFRNPKPELLALLQDSGSADANGVRGKDASKKKARRDKAVDMEKLADGLQKLSEDDLLHVVTMVHDNKTSETYTKNDVENGEFHVDLYTLPDSLVKMLWDFTASKTDL